MLVQLKRATKELLGRRQWAHPTRPVVPTTLEEQVYAALVHPGDLVFDVGANRGEVADLCARLATPIGAVWAFEPVWPTYQELCAHLQLNDEARASITTIPLALSDTNGTATLTMPGNHSQLSSIANADIMEATMNEGATSFTCDTMRLDDFRARVSLPAPHVLKIDVEGAEVLMLRGAADTLRARPFLVIEVYAPVLRNCGYRPWDVLSILTDAGYRLWFGCPDGLVEHTPTPTRPYPDGYANGYFVVAGHPNSAQVARLEGLHRLLVGTGHALPVPPPPWPNT